MTDNQQTPRPERGRGRRRTGDSEMLLGVRCSRAMYDSIHRSAKKNGRTFSGEVRWAMQHYLDAELQVTG